MSSCSNVPVELVLATTDPDLYDASTNKWKWGGQMWWAVECLPSKQRSVADGIVPKISPSNYLKLDTSPSTWDYCKSQACTVKSDFMQLVFTFNPQSTNPNDFLQYVFDIHCNVTDYPRHEITDQSGKKLYLDIVEISKMTKQPYVEIWIANAHQYAGAPGLTVQALQAKGAPATGGGATLWIVIAVLLLLLIIGIVLFFVFRKGKSKPAAISPGLGFIG